MSETAGRRFPVSRFLWGMLAAWCAFSALGPMGEAVDLASWPPASLWPLTAALLSAVSALALVLARCRGAGVGVTRFVLGFNGALLLGMALQRACQCLDKDEPAHLNFAWLIGHGWVPYRDFLDMHHFFWHALTAPLLWVMKDNLQVVVVAKLLTLTVTLLALGLAAYLSHCMGGSSQWTVLGGLALSQLMMPGTEYRADPPAALLMLASLILLHRGRPWSAGTCGGLAFLMSQKGLIQVLAVAVGLVVSRWHDDRPRVASLVVRYLLSAALVGGLYWVWAAYYGILPDYLRDCYIYPTFFRRFFTSQSVLTSQFVLMVAIEWGANKWLVALSLVGLVQAWRQGGLARQVSITAVLCWLSALWTGIGYRQYLMFPNLLLLSLLEVPPSPREGQRSIAGGRPDLLPSLTLVCCCFLGLARWAGQPHPPMDLRDASIALRSSLEGDSFYGEDNLGESGNPIFRPCATFYPAGPILLGRMFNHFRLRTPHGDPLDVRQMLLQHPPKVMIFSNAQRRDEALAALKEAGCEYRHEGNVWIRTP